MNGRISAAAKLAASTILAASAIFAALACASCNVDGAGYVYSRTTPDERFAESRSMTQPSPTAVPDDFSFIFLSDTHIENGSHGNLDNLKAHLDGAAFVIVGGDITQNGKQPDVDAFRKFRDALGVPVYAVPGNHDLYDGGWARTKSVGPSSFTVSLGQNARLICLDSANGTLGIRQTEWLTGLLESSKEQTIIVATHMQFFTSDFFETQEYNDPEETAMLLSAYKRAGVDLVLAGHSHKFAEADIGSMRYRVSGSFLDGKNRAHYMRITCSGEKISVERRAY
jgi:predicted phosphodiesterase